MIVTVARYRTIAADTVTPDLVATDALEFAAELLEEDLGRPLDEAERTETMWLDRAGWVWPRANPIISVATPGWIPEGDLLRPAVAWQPTGDILLGHPEATVDITYTGGWVERTANPAAPNRLPASIEADLAWAAHALTHRNSLASSVPAGATSVRLGDVSVSFGPGGAAAELDMTIRWSRRTMRWRR